MAWFEDWFCTRYYAVLYGHRDEQDARMWVDPIIQRTGLKPGDELLDMACGRGRHAQWFIRSGIRVTGIDLSDTSILEAQRSNPEGHFAVHDIRQPFARQRFQVVVCLFTSLGYSADRADDQRAVNAAAEALVPGGLLVLDLLNGEKVARTLVADECQSVDGIRFSIHRSLENGYIVKHIRVNDTTGVSTYEERVHAWHEEEVRRMVEQAGFRIEAITDGPEPTVFDPLASDRIVVWGRKPS